MRLTKLFVGSLVAGGVLAATALLTTPETRRPSVTPARSLQPQRLSRPDCPPPQIAPSCPPGATDKYILWDKR